MARASRRIFGAAHLEGLDEFPDSDDAASQLAWLLFAVAHTELCCCDECMPDDEADDETWTDWPQ